MSKGSGRRPQQIDRAEMDRRWEETFGGDPERILVPASMEEVSRTWRATLDALEKPFGEVNDVSKRLGV